MMRFLTTLSIFFFVTFLAIQSSYADEAGSAVEKAKIEQLLKTLKDEKQRKEFIETLETALNAHEKQQPDVAQSHSLSDVLMQSANNLYEEVGVVADSLKNYKSTFSTVQKKLSDPEFYPVLVKFLIGLSLIFIAGLFFEYILKKILHKKRRSIEQMKLEKLHRKVIFLCARTILDLIPILGFAVASYITLQAIDTFDNAEKIISAFIQANVLIRILVAFVRIIFVPKAPHLRLLQIKDYDAVYYFTWAKRLGNIAIYGWFLAETVYIATGLENLYDFSGKIVAFIFTAFLIVFILQNKDPIATILRKLPPNSGKFVSYKNRLTSLAYILVIGYIIVLYSVWLFNVQNGFQLMFENTALTIVMIVAAILLSYTIQKLTGWFLRPDEEAELQYPNLQQRMAKYSGIMRTLLNILITFLTFIIIAQIWGMHSLNVTSSAIGQKIFFSSLTIFFIAVITLSIWEAIQYFIDKIMHEKLSESDARLRTLLPLVRNVFFVIILIISSLLILSELGVNIAPLLAGAGVLGLAIGFGSQALVKDVITGFFILVEDTISIGDVITTSGHTGVVNHITIRTLQLRDASGCVHTIPFSDVTTIVNMTKDFSYAVMEIGVAYNENIDYVIDVINEIGLALQKDHEMEDLILEPIEILGLDQFADSAVIIKARIKTVRLKQWKVRRAFNLLMKRKFDELGIEIPFPHVTIYAGEDKQGNAPSLPLKIEKEITDK